MVVYLVVDWYAVFYVLDKINSRCWVGWLLSILLTDWLTNHARNRQTYWLRNRQVVCVAMRLRGSPDA